MKHFKRSVPLVVIGMIAILFCVGFVAVGFAAPNSMVLKLSEIHPKGYPT